MFVTSCKSVRAWAVLAVLISLKLCAVCQAQSSVQYTIQDVGPAAYNTNSARGLNKYGDVVGYSLPTTGPNFAAFLYSSATASVQDLNVYNSIAVGINDSEQVAIASYDSFISDGYVWQAGNLTSLTGELEGIWPVVPAGINNKGQVGGTLAPWLFQALTLWDPSGAIVTNYTTTTAVAINDSGVIVGDRQYSSDDSGAIWWSQQDDIHPLLGQLGGVPTAINASGLVAGGPSTITRNSGLPLHAFRTKASLTAQQSDYIDLGTLGGDYSFGWGIDSAGDVVGESNAVANGPHYAFLWHNGLMQDLNPLIPPNSGWTLGQAIGINDYGQICGTGTNPAGQQHAFLLTPTATHIAVNLISVSACYPGGTAVDGIVCDNLPNMDPALLDRLKISIPGYEQGDFSDSRIVGVSAGRLDTSHLGVVYYCPPDEFNVNQTPSAPTDITKEATRQVTLMLRVKSGGQNYTVDPKQLILARPPVVLVHGINSDPSSWNPFIAGLSDYRVPFVTVNHSNPTTMSSYDFHNGNDPVEIGAALLADRLKNVLASVRNGFDISDRNTNTFSVYPSQNQVHTFSDYVGERLAIRRADIVAWSYGGIITRWYLASDGSTTSRNWYDRPTSIPLPAPKYNADVRKVITLGSMWRGVPLANLVNEGLSGPLSGISLRSSPINNNYSYALDFFDFAGHIQNQTLADVLGDISLFIPMSVPSFEVMAVNSPWLSQLIYGNPMPAVKSIASPFVNAVAYGAIAGQVSDYPFVNFLGLTKTYRQYVLLDGTLDLRFADPPGYSWFPYFAMEYGSDSTADYSDGLVPLWSAQIPGLWNFLAPTSHADLNCDTATQTQALLWLNDDRLPHGDYLKTMWNDPQRSQVSSSSGRIWTFQQGEMAPHAQNDIYQQFPDPLLGKFVGRINPTAVKEINSIQVTKVTSVTAAIQWVTATDADGKVDLYTGSPGSYTFVGCTLQSGTIGKIHLVSLSGLLPNTDYYFDATSSIGNGPDRPIVVHAAPSSGSLIHLKTPPYTKPLISVTFVTSNIGTNSFTIHVANSGGIATGFHVVGCTFTAPGYTYTGSNPSQIDVGPAQTVTISYSPGPATTSLLVKLQFTYQDGLGNSMSGTTSYLRLK